MIKRGSMFFMLGILVILTAGCQTCKGVAKGAAETAKGAAEGAKKDWHDLMQLDAKMRETLW